jgi:UDP-N-acetylglucosamine 4,6-dehydratase/5-epimerase
MNKENIMIIGAGGSLGKCLCKLLRESNYDITAVDINENSLAYLYRVCNVQEGKIYIEDIRNFNKLKNIIEYNEIDTVVNCAALKHVMWCEYNIKHAIDINIVANLELINYIDKKEKKFLYISSDKATNPQNIYALTKQFTDYIVNLYNFKLVRGVNFLNSKGSVLDLWEEQLKLKKDFTLIDNEECNRYFITIKYMAELVKFSIEDNSGKKEYVPEKIYKIYIHDLFKAFLRKKNISIEDRIVKKILLLDIEKITEDLNFDPKIIEERDIDKIVNLLDC